jgi:DNA-binding transcriptional ArsR family regulator
LQFGYNGEVTGSSCIPALKALGEETRLRMLRLLFCGPLSVNEISDRLKVSQYNISKHLRVMREAGLLKSEKRGKLRFYGVSQNLRKQMPRGDGVLDLGCCTFRLDKLPK